MVDGTGSARAAECWSTRLATRSVLAIAHNVTAATRLFDVVHLLGEDDRLRMVFTCTGSSAFHDGTLDHLAERGVRCVPWAEALAGSFDLAISASYGGDLHLITAPLVVVPHGMGYNKYLNRKSEIGFRLVA